MKNCLIGVGGATCSGKTTLAKHLQKCLPGSYIIHQDDFAPPQEKIPINPEYGVQDWDDPPGAIDWPRMRSSLAHVKETGKLPDSHYSHDHLNEQVDVPLPPGMTEFWRERFVDAIERYRSRAHGEGEEEGIAFQILDGFLLYYDQEITEDMDVRIMLRVPEAELKRRRHARHGYHTAVQSDPEGTLWRDPPHYWEQIVYPAYVKAHAHLFVSGDLENGPLEPEAQEKRRIELLEADKMSMAELLDATCSAILEFLVPGSTSSTASEAAAAEAEAEAIDNEVDENFDE